MNFRRNSQLIGYRHSPPLAIRWGRPEDAAQLDALAALDEALVPPAPLMLGFVEGELWAAVSVSTGERIADPFKPSAEVARLLAERGRQLTVLGRRRGFRLPRRRRQAAGATLKAQLGPHSV